MRRFGLSPFRSASSFTPRLMIAHSKDKNQLWNYYTSGRSCHIVDTGGSLPRGFAYFGKRAVVSQGM